MRNRKFAEDLKVGDRIVHYFGRDTDYMDAEEIVTVRKVEREYSWQLKLTVARDDGTTTVFRAEPMRTYDIP